MTFARSTMSAPPGGLWFWSDADHFISGPDYNGVVDRISALFSETGVSKDPKEALAEYMCPRMPPGFCTGEYPREKTVIEYLRAGEPYFFRRPVMSDTVERRMSRCLSCPCHRVVGCLHCLRADEAAYLKFGGRRAILPIDRKSGVCGCAGTLAMVVASVSYDEGEPVWEGAPAGCWRFG